MKGNKFYQDHLKALEQMEREEQKLKQDVKAKILEQAKYMEYNDDFDSEDELMGDPKRKKRGLS